jgi:4-amino-4-deoxy-L-arabinose transferase-like glycosyltransferase
MPLADDGRPIAAVRGAPSGAGNGSHGGCSFLLAAIAALLIARIPVIFTRAFDNDEFEHSHAAWSVFKGLLPYRDFFEHHTPWYYFTLSPFFGWVPVDQSFEAARHFLIFGRFLSLALTALSAALVFLVGRLGATRRVGLLATLLFVAQPVLIHKTLEIRPDVPALSFFIGALWFLRHGLLAQQASPARHLRWFLAGGLCLGATAMFTQKMLFVLPGALVGLGLWTLAGGRRGLASRGAAILILLLGVTAPAMVTWIGFALHGSGGQFIYNNFVLNAHWRLRSGRHLLVVLTTSGPILLLCLVGAWSPLFRRGPAEPRDDGDLLLLCTLGGLVAGIAVVPAAYEQYYLPPLTIACLFAARGLSFLLDGSRHRARGWLVVCATVPLLIWPVVDLGRSLGDRDDVQMARLRFVFAHTGPADRVLDGWLGTNVFRPQPHYYFFMHGELLAMLTTSEKDAYLDALTSGKNRPALIALDDELRALGPRFLQFVGRNYVSGDGLFYLPVQPAPYDADPQHRLR